MKKIKYIIALSLLVLGSLVMLSCQNDDVEINNIVAPSNIEVTTSIIGATADNPEGDGSGQVAFDIKAANAISYQIKGEGINQTLATGRDTINLSNSGVNDYVLSIIAIGAGGTTSNEIVNLRVRSDYTPPQALIDKLTKGEWRIKQEVALHFSLGPVGGSIIGEFFPSPPRNKEGRSIYDDRYIFNKNGTFTHITDNTNDDPVENPDGTVFGRDIYINQLDGPKEGVVEEGQDIYNYPLQDNTGTWSLSAPGGKETISLSGKSFIGYYIGENRKYEIFQDTNDDFVLRATDENGDFDWWFIITNVEEGNEPAPEKFVSSFTDLSWSDEFDSDGAPDSEIWGYDLGDDGFGNNEVQNYTQAAKNVFVKDGFLTINAIKESDGSYTSARLKSQDKYEFTYGRVEVRAKLPAAGGTWPAIWMLGANFPEVGWPTCGEIDIMEHVGNKIDDVSSALHYPGRNGGNAVVQRYIIDDVTTEFHTYSADWTAEEIVFLVDDEVVHRFANNPDLPFVGKDFFFILNIAVGGTLGGAIDPAFTESSMEIDYVRLYK